VVWVLDVTSSGLPSHGVERGSLIRIRVLCELLVKTLEGVEDRAFRSPELLDELRRLANRATEELDQPGGFGSE
jgi:hypothetical protein